MALKRGLATSFFASIGLGLSQKDYGALIGASALSVYKWEKGEVRPRQRSLEAIARIRSIGKKEAAARLNRPAA